MMAMQHCLDCKEPVSLGAYHCPNCRRLANYGQMMFILRVVWLILIAGTLFANQPF